MKNFAKRLIDARTAKGWTQAELAKHAGVSQSTIGNLEAGSRSKPRNIVEIAAALDMTPDELLTGKPPSRLAEVKPELFLAYVTSKEGQLLRAYREATPDSRRVIDAVISTAERRNIVDVLGVSNGASIVNGDS